MNTVENRNFAQPMNAAQLFLLFESGLDFLNFGSLQCIPQ
jgi:hypothetical protein